LPNAGIHSAYNGALTRAIGSYWTSDPLTSDDHTNYANFAHRLTIDGRPTSSMGALHRATGASVRCVAQ